jgi:hypothetical protein
MSANLILLTTLVYFYVAMEQWFTYNNLGMFIAYLGYSFANIGLYMLASK